MKYDVLVICPKFYDYEIKLKNELIRRSLNCKFVFYNENELLTPSNIGKIILLILRMMAFVTFRDYTVSDFYNKLRNKFILINSQSQLINSIDGDLLAHDYDKLLVIKGFGFNSSFFSNVRAKKKILYQWDSLIKYPSVLDFYSCFDNVFTFDENDANAGFGEYLPNFYVCDDNAVNDNRDIGCFYLVFVGAFSVERYVLLKKIITHAEKNNINSYFHLYLKDKFGLKGFFLDKRIVKSSMLHREDYEHLINNASCMLEITQNGQCGGSQRVLEGVSKNKLIIINKSGSHYDENFILDVDDYLGMKKCDIDAKIKKIKKIDNPYLKYEIKNWVESVLFKDEI